MLLLALAWAAPSQDLWVELHSREDMEAARAAGLGWGEGQDGDWYRLIGTVDQAEEAGLRWRLAAMESGGWIPDAEEVAGRLEALSQPALVQIGASVLGEPLLAARFGTGGRALRILGGHHGNEGSSIEVALSVAEALDAQRVSLPADTEVWIVPLVNPDGAGAGTRENAMGVDLNRNYAWEWSASEINSGTEAFSEPESRAIRALSRARGFDAGLSLHSGSQNLGWVWNWTAELRPQEEPLLITRAEAYAERCTAPDFWLTNGADWYITRGDTTDWAFGAWGSYDYTLEITDEKSPSFEEISTYTSWHLDAILAWITTPADVSTHVVDAETNEPIPAWISAATTPLWSPDGQLSRWGEGPWTVGATGYDSATLATQTALVPSSLLTILPVPRLISKGAGPTVIRLDGAADGALRLEQPGEPSVSVAADGPGEWTIDPGLLASGAWTIVAEDGVVPRALFIGEVDDRVTIEVAELVESNVTLRGAGFAPGAEAWSIGGPARAAHPLELRSQSADTLVFGLPSTDEDLLVWVNGAWLSVVGVHGPALVDETPPAERATQDEVPSLNEPNGYYAGGACTSAHAPHWLLGAGMLLARRRRPRSFQPASSTRDAS